MKYACITAAMLGAITFFSSVAEAQNAPGLNISNLISQDYGIVGVSANAVGGGIIIVFQKKKVLVACSTESQPDKALIAGFGEVSILLTRACYLLNSE